MLPDTRFIQAATQKRIAHVLVRDGQKIVVLSPMRQRSDYNP